jgi:hypothetical protein
MQQAVKLLSSVISVTVLGGCALPVLEGGQMRLMNGGESKNAIEELSKIDIAYNLDPKRRGFCHQSPSEGAGTAPTAAQSIDYATSTKPRDSTYEIRCAIDGFHSETYFNELGKNERAALEVSNVTFAFAEKQTSRIGELSKKLDEVVQKFDTAYRATLQSKLQAEVIDRQVIDLTNRVEMATKHSAYLEFQRRRRNSVQESFIAASDAACDFYKRNLNNVYSTSNFSFGTTATVAGGLGAAVTSESAARALAAIAGVTSGVRAEYNDAFFRNKVVELLTKAMDIARVRKKEEIRRRSTQLLADYSVENALGDAIVYNSQCSLVAGLQETSESLQTVSDPGLKWLANAFGGAASDRALTATLFDALGKAVGTVQAIQRSTEDQNAVTSGTTETAPQRPGNGQQGTPNPAPPPR